MPVTQTLLEKLSLYAVGRRGVDDNLFANDKPSSGIGIFDVDDEALCHEVIQSTCSVPGCQYTADNILEFENHYNSSHRYTCSQCKKCLLSAHLLDLHLQEAHDSFFAVLAQKKPSYSCYIEECKEKFWNPSERAEHCVQEHKMPKNFKFSDKFRSAQESKNNQKDYTSMEIDVKQSDKKVFLANSKQKTFTKYTGKKFTGTDKKSTKCVNMDDVVEELKESLPE